MLIDLLAAAGERTHDRRAAADVAAVADDDPGGDPAFDHRGAERAGVEVDEALVHHGGAGGQVRAEADPVGVGDAHAARRHVVDHPRELVDAVDRQPAARPARSPAAARRPDPAGTGRPRSTRRWPEGRRCRRGWPGAAGSAGGTAGAGGGTRRPRRPGASASDPIVVADLDHLGSRARARPALELDHRASGARAETEVAGRVPDVERLAVGGDRGQAVAPAGEVTCDSSQLAHRTGRSLGSA